LLFQHFEPMIPSTAKEHHARAATLWRLTVETWLRRQVLMLIRQNRNQQSVTHFFGNLDSE
jgi:hypothetical protein